MKDFLFTMLLLFFVFVSAMVILTPFIQKSWWIQTQNEVESLRSEVLTLTEELYKERVEFCRGIKRAEENRGEAIHQKQKPHNTKPVSP